MVKCALSEASFNANVIHRRRVIASLNKQSPRRFQNFDAPKLSLPRTGRGTGRPANCGRDPASPVPNDPFHLNSLAGKRLTLPNLGTNLRLGFL